MSNVCSARRIIGQDAYSQCTSYTTLIQLQAMRIARILLAANFSRVYCLCNYQLEVIRQQHAQPAAAHIVKESKPIMAESLRLVGKSFPASLKYDSQQTGEKRDMINQSRGLIFCFLNSAI